MFSLLVAIFLVSSFSESVFSLNAHVRDSLVYTNLGDDVELFASITPPHVAISSDPHDGIASRINKICRWKRYSLNSPVSGPTITINATENEVEVKPAEGKFQYFGKGVDAGECGLRILNISPDELGEWKFTFVDTIIWTANVTVLEYEKPLPPVISTKTVDKFSEGINVTDFGNGSGTVYVHCCSKGGLPIADTKLELSLENKLQDASLDSRDTKSTCIKWITNFTSMDNGKVVKCFLKHPAFGKDSASAIGHPASTETLVAVNVNYAPKFLTDKDNQDKLAITEHFRGKEIDLIINVHGNPVPYIKFVYANDGSELKPKNVTVDRTSNGNLNIFTVTFNSISSQKAINITIENYLGKDIGVTIVSPSPGEEESSFWTLLIIGIVMSVFFLGIIGFILNFSAKQRGWLCYKGRISDYNVKNPKCSTTVSYTTGDEYTSVTRVDSEYE